MPHPHMELTIGLSGEGVLIKADEHGKTIESNEIPTEIGSRMFEVLENLKRVLVSAGFSPRRFKVHLESIAGSEGPTGATITEEE